MNFENGSGPALQRTVAGWEMFLQRNYQEGIFGF